MDLFEPWLLPIDCCTCANSSFSPALVPPGFLPGAMNLKPPQLGDIVKDDASLGVIPEGGDASTIIAPTPDMKTYNGNRTPEGLEINAKDMLALQTQMSQCPLLRLSNKFSSSIIDTALYSHVGLVERGVLNCDTEPESLSVESSGFPYYRTHKSCGGFQDVVLVKDVGISCTLLGADTNSSKTSSRGSTLLEGLLLNQLRIECSDISEITKKISAYTKDILQSLSLKKKGKDKSLVVDVQIPRGEFHLSSRQPVAMEYTDKTGRPCLKLRLVKSEKFSSPVELKQFSWWNLAMSKKNLKVKDAMKRTINLKPTQQTRRTIGHGDALMRKQASTENNNPEQVLQLKRLPNRDYKWNVPRPHVKQVRQLYPKEPGTVELESSTCSSSSIYDFLMMRNRRTLIKGKKEQLTCSKLTNYGPSKLNKNRSRKSIAKTVAVFPNDSCRDAAKTNIKNLQLLTCQKTYHSLQSCKKERNPDKRSWTSATPHDIKYSPISESQTVDIYIARHKRGI